MIDAGFDDQGDRTMGRISDDARLGKEGLLEAPVRQEFDLTGFSDAEVKVFQGRLQFPDKIKGLVFDPEKLMKGIISGDYVDEKAETVRVYYPHFSGGKLMGRTVFDMKLDDATRLLKKCAQVLGVSDEDLKAGVGSYSTGQSIRTSVHMSDIAYGLDSRLSK